MGLLAQAITVFALAFGVCAWLLGRYFLSTSDMGVLREQLLASGETAALEEQQEAIAQAGAFGTKTSLGSRISPASCTSGTRRRWRSRKRRRAEKKEEKERCSGR